ncbi:unnamed protein product [Ixodes hexagonus]
MCRSWLNAQPQLTQGKHSCDSSLGILSDTFSGDGFEFDDKSSEVSSTPFRHPFADKSSLTALFQGYEEVAEQSMEGQASRQDVTRPSWLSEGADRVSILSYFKSRSAPIQGIPPSSIVATPSTAEPGLVTSMAESLEDLAMQEFGLGASNASRAAIPDSSVQGPSTSTLYRVLDDLSVSESPSTMVRKFISATRSHKHPSTSEAAPKQQTTADTTFKQPLAAAPRTRKAPATEQRASADETPVNNTSVEAVQCLLPGSRLLPADDSSSALQRRKRERCVSHAGIWALQLQQRGTCGFEGGGLSELTALPGRHNQRGPLSAFLRVHRALDTVRLPEVQGVTATP